MFWIKYHFDLHSKPLTIHLDKFFPPYRNLHSKVPIFPCLQRYSNLPGFFDIFLFSKSGSFLREHYIVLFFLLEIKKKNLLWIVVGNVILYLQIQQMPNLKIYVLKLCMKNSNFHTQGGYESVWKVEVIKDKEGFCFLNNFHQKINESLISLYRQVVRYLQEIFEGQFLCIICNVLIHLKYQSKLPTNAMVQENANH
eukprot:Pompholyxophrys_punicea_v1_NODE_525_length_1763_cov_5.398712.p2 type:complete len:197 gc:universal NODE_525_length_1763_cov_5.398712:989-399(-)